MSKAVILVQITTLFAEFLLVLSALEEVESAGRIRMLRSFIFINCKLFKIDIVGRD
jgi:hypothetical protein